MSRLLKKTWHTFGFVKRVPFWVFLILFALSGIFSVYALRHNNQTMITLRSEVYEADKNNTNVEAALAKLRLYVYGHMNTNLSSGGNAIKPPIQLKYTYDRLQAAEQQRVNTINSQIYTDAQNYCQAQNPVAFSGRTRVPCVQDYVSSHGVQVNPIPTALYQFDFVSPSWSPDLAGWSLVVTVLLFLAFLVSYTINRLVNSRIKSQEI